MEPSAGIEPAFRAYQARVLPFDDDGVVDRRGFEPRLEQCECPVLPLNTISPWCERRVSSPLPPPCRGGALPVSYSRIRILVESAGIEPASSQCHCDVFPLDDDPIGASGGIRTLTSRFSVGRYDRRSCRGMSGTYEDRTRLNRSTTDPRHQSRHVPFECTTGIEPAFCAPQAHVLTVGRRTRCAPKDSNPHDPLIRQASYRWMRSAFALFVRRHFRRHCVEAT